MADALGKAMVNPWLGMALVLAVLGGLLGGLRLYQHFGSPHPELVRKILHLGMGLVTLTFPWLFHAAWPVLLLASVSIGVLVALSVVGCLKSALGSVVGGVARFSLGEIYFPLAVTVLFLLFLREVGTFAHRAVLYCIPILLLTLADAAAALIGVSYGRWHYQTADGVKSWEGSLAFFTCAFFCAHVPLLLFTQTGRPETLLIAGLLAWLATMFEAIAWRGLDNLALPLVSFLLLKIYLKLDAGELVTRLWAVAVLMLFLVLYRRRTTLIGSAVLGAFLVGYISWALGGWEWLLPPLILFLCYTLLSPRTEVNSQRIHTVHAVVCVASAGLAWLFLATIFNHPELLFPYTLSFAAHLAIIGIARLRYDYPHLPGLNLLVICITKGWLLLFLPCLLVQRVFPVTLACVLISLLGVAAAAVGFYWTQPGIDNCPTDTPRWLRQAVHAAVASALGLVPLYLQV
jgi:phytol kinase